MSVRDSADNAVAGIPVTLVVESASVDATAVSIVTSPTTTDTNGEAVFTVSSSVAQAVQFKASFNPDLFISVTWASAPVPATPVPTMNNYLLVLLALALLLIAGRRVSQLRD